MQHKHNMAEMASQLTQPFMPLMVEQVDDYCAFLAHIEGSYIFHQHPKDEMYLVLEGEVAMDFADGGSVILKQGESLVTRSGEKHRSRSDEGALVLVFRHKDCIYGPGRLGRIKEAIRSNLPLRRGDQ